MKTFFNRSKALLCRGIKVFAAFVVLINFTTAPVQTLALSSVPASLAISSHQIASSGSPQSASDPVIAAAGDIACDPANAVFNNGNGNPNACRQKATSDLLVNSNLAAVLDLGDTQYFCGSYQAFLQSYDLSWGRVKSITHPVLGNHELLTTGDPSGAPSTNCTIDNEHAAGYWNYFGTAGGTPPAQPGPAGQAGIGYYSYDIGGWHIIALDSDCTNAGGCGATSPEGTWLQNDLAADTKLCTLAYWHVPLFSSGGRASLDTKAFWQILYNNGVDIVLNGHDHIYERFAPQDPNGAADFAHGIREFIVGTGGADHTSLVQGPLAANSEVQNVDTYGVLKLTLHSNSTDWQFVPEAGKTFTDSGTTVCHAIDKIPPTAPTNLTATPVSASQANLTWTASTDNVGVTGYGIYRNGVQIGTSSGTSYSDGTLQANMGYSYYVVAFDAANHASPASNTAAIPTPQASIVFNDGFESGNLSQWTVVQGLVVQSQEVFSGNYAARGTSNAGPATYARKALAATQSDLYYRIRFKSISQGANNASLLKFRTAADASILSLGINNLGQLSYHNDVTGGSVNSTTTVSKGSWQTLQVHVKIANTASQIEVWYNDAPVSALTRTDSFGTTPIGRLQLGENTPGLTYDIAFDDVKAALGFIVDTPPASTATPSATPTFTPTFTSTSTSTSTNTSTATLTPILTSTPTPTSTSTPTSSPTLTSTSTPTFTPTLAATSTPTLTSTAAPTFTATPTATTAQSSVVFSDDFESGDLSHWTLVQGLVVQQQEVANGNFAARGTSSAGAATYARKLLAAAQSDLYYRIRFKVISQGANTVNLMKFRTATDASILSVSISNVGHLSYRNDIAGTSVNSSLIVSKGSWQTLQVHVRIANTASQVEFWYNGVPVSDLTRTESLSTNSIGRLQLGENTSGLIYDIAFDDVQAALGFIIDSPPAATFTQAFTPTPTNTLLPLPTQTASPTPTSTPVPAATSTPTPQDTSTSSPTALPTNTATPAGTSAPTGSATPTPT